MGFFEQIIMVSDIQVLDLLYNLIKFKNISSLH